MPAPRIDESIAFVPVRIAVLTVSDTRNASNDTSGDALAARIAEAGHVLAARTLLRDDQEQITARLRSWIADPAIDVVISTGGTGLTGRDVTVEAFRSLFEKEIDGFSVLMHMLSYEKVGTSTIQSRSLAGVSRGTYIFCVPGSPGACRDAWTLILRHQLDFRHRPCNMVEIMPRLMENEVPQAST